MSKLEDVNRLSESGMSEFRIQSYDGWRLVVIGSFDLCYYHDIEVTFTGVTHINLPTEFWSPMFAEIGDDESGNCSSKRFTVRADGQSWGVMAEAVEVVVGKVYHYDRGQQLMPGERIANWAAPKLNLDSPVVRQNDPLQSNQLPELPAGFGYWVRFTNAEWSCVPESPGVYAIGEPGEILYIGMAGRDGGGNLRRRLRDHASGQVVNMFSQYLFFAKAQFTAADRVVHPSQAKALCRQYIEDWCSFAWLTCSSASESRAIETELRSSLRPTLNGK